MPTTQTVHDRESVARLAQSLNKILEKAPFVEVAYSSTGMRVEDLNLSSLPQKALKAIWIRELCGSVFKKKPNEASEAEYEGMNRYLKMACNADTKQSFLLREIVNPANGQSKNEVTSSAKWSPGEMTFFLDWVQRYGAEKGVILEAKGEFKELSQGQSR